MLHLTLFFSYHSILVKLVLASCEILCGCSRLQMQLVSVMHSVTSLVVSVYVFVYPVCVQQTVESFDLET